ncbi:MAG: hypothetical protein ACPLQO_10115, partial [Desulfotomaculales bacterium]
AAGRNRRLLLLAGQRFRPQHHFESQLKKSRGGSGKNKELPMGTLVPAINHEDRLRVFNLEFA